MKWSALSGPLAAGLCLICAALALTPARADDGGQALAEAAGRELIGTPAPRLVLKTIDGQSIDLGALYGRKAVYLKFWATWCAPCREQMPHFERSYEEAGPDLAVIAVDTGFNDTLEDVRKYREALHLQMPMVIDDGRLAAALNLRVTPQHVVIGRDGRIRYVGHLADAALDQALADARKTPTSVVAGGAVPKDEPRYEVGELLPKLPAQTLDGAPFPLRDAGDKRPTVLVFFSPWCETYLAASRPAAAAECRAAREQVTALAQDGRARWLGVAFGLWASDKDVAAYRSGYHIAMPLTLDQSGALFRSFRVSRVPTLLLADADGRIVRRIEGVDAQLPAELKALYQP